MLGFTASVLTNKTFYNYLHYPNSQNLNNILHEVFLGPHGPLELGLSVCYHYEF